MLESVWMLRRCSYAKHLADKLIPPKDVGLTSRVLTVQLNSSPKLIKLFAKPTFEKIICNKASHKAFFMGFGLNSDAFFTLPAKDCEIG